MRTVFFLLVGLAGICTLCYALYLAFPRNPKGTGVKDLRKQVNVLSLRSIQANQLLADLDSAAKAEYLVNDSNHFAAYISHAIDEHRLVT